MNRQFTAIVVTILGLLGAIWISLSIATNANPLSGTARYFIILGVIFGVLAPRAAMYLLIFCCGYLDLYKRLLVFGGGFGGMDLIFILGTAPMIVVGMVIAYIFSIVTGRTSINRLQILLVSIFVMIVGVFMAYAFKEGLGMVGVLQAAANSASYSALLFLVPTFFPGRRQFLRLIGIASIIFLPVAIYGIYQGIFGLANWEERYLTSGYTMMIKELHDVRPRPFSTLNSSHSLAVTSAMFTVICLIPWFVRARDSGIPYGRGKGLVFSLVYLGGLIAAVNRSSWVLLLSILFLRRVFVSVLRTVIFVGVSVTLFLFICFKATYMLEHISEWDSKIEKRGAFQTQALRIQTFSDRLYGFRNLVTSSRMWTPFGVAREDRTETGGAVMSHDLIGSTLLAVGYVPLIFGLVFGFIGVLWLQAKILSVPDGTDREVSILLFGIVMCILGNS
ncbi:MAG: hypothetical protein AAGD22_14990, partial [Verrucomicrobiota bacterium]